MIGDLLYLLLTIILYPFYSIKNMIEFERKAKILDKIWMDNSFPFYDENGNYQGRYNKHTFEIRNGKIEFK